MLALHGHDDWLFIDEAGAEPLRQDAVVILLNPHLLVLSEGFALPTPAGVTGQLDLFPATPVGEPARRPVPSARRQDPERRRRLA